MAEIKDLSEINMVHLVRDILHGKDLSKVTPRTVREEVISRLGEKVTSDGVALKAVVRSALDIVLTDGMGTQKVDPVKHRAEDKYNIHFDQLKGAAVTYGYHDADVQDEALPDDDDGGYSLRDEDEESVPWKWVECNKSESQQRAKKRARAEEKSTVKGQKDLESLKKVCRRLGCTAPPFRQKGFTLREKCSNVLAFLRSKGIMANDPTRLSKEAIDAHRMRIEREKDLEGLDVSNIIEEGRPKRQRAAVKASKYEELPSDLSGPDLSENSEDEGEEFAVSDADFE